MLIEVCVHIQSFAIRRPATNLDPPFHVGCQNPVMNVAPRANATLVMLARNSDVSGAVHSVKSVQTQFNDHFRYPWVFLNDEKWSAEFMEKVGKAAGEGVNVKFEKIPRAMWGYPEWIDQDKARRKMEEMERRGIMYAGQESYHHMCRFQSGFFYDHPALESYKWYWRVEPDISFTCAITYDPFIEMEKHGKKYGYTIALWERGTTVASLFRKLSDYKARVHIPSTSLWTAMIDPSYLPWPFRRFLSLLRNRDAYGDIWNMCHFWSNFEIADMDFFRSPAYRSLFRYLDEDGGFYYERWGDAPVHSLAAALLLRPEELHHFSDFGYIHANLQYCTHAPTDEARRRGELVPMLEGRGEELGCRCTCDLGIKIVEPVCLNRIKQTVG
ncbi:glycosyltransferase family 15 protein [Cucurbitaria berberidis CBS 394.84]|uniref:Glycosyltransferase family 15 protein n=1 Tax=Cucurbitaria berberidis CBS 394.84 TaxID=1168544 RepID=A0A9P4GUP1_9PLEO|nr:glycosyltransferase family 15 protein [Cucurbitaria berberidis CBS 394.84]KAF1851652.1 glycosyltransferase family 15 protein [Cucurbitaria berberidis CBS 394.84]